MYYTKKTSVTYQTMQCIKRARTMTADYVRKSARATATYVTNIVCTIADNVNIIARADF
jgi:hypothetical protein